MTQNSVFQSNKNEMKSVISNFIQENKSEMNNNSNIWHFFFSENSRAMYNRLISTKQQVNPNTYKSTKEYHENFKQYPQYCNVSENTLKSKFHESTTTLNFSEIGAIDPQLGALKSRVNIKFINLAGVVIKSKDVFKKLNLFKQLTSLSLSNCGLMEIPKKLPPTIKNLDLSYNYINDIPLGSIKWEQFERLNLSKNSFIEWPQNLNPTVFPNLVYLSLAWNRIENANPITLFSCFPKLLYLDLSYCSLNNYPRWLIMSKSIHVLNLAGNSEIIDFSLSLLSKMCSLKYIDISNININESIITEDQDKVFSKSLDKIISKENNYNLIEINNCSVVYK